MQADTEAGRKTEQHYWEGVHSHGGVRMRLPSPLDVATADFMRLMRRYVRPGMRVLEVGFAPGKNLVWLAKALGARASGVDYAGQGVETGKRLFSAVGVEGDLRCEDFFATTFPSRSFDVVYSLGVVEHFDDPRTIIQKHADLLAPGGKALVVIPNYGGLYGALQRYCDPENLGIHNLNIMSERSFYDVGPHTAELRSRTFPFGRINPWLVSFHRRMPPRVARLFSYFLNGVGVVQPVAIPAISPWLVLEITRSGA